MGKFKEAFSNMAEKIEDLSSLDVVTFSGSVTLESSSTGAPTSFETVIKKAIENTEINVKVLASTQIKMDGDIVTFYDTDIKESEKLAHTASVETGVASRQATIDFIKDAIGGAISNI